MEKYFDVVRNFNIEGEPVKIMKWGQGHINDTFLVELDNGKKIILQKINTVVFTKPDEVMKNIIAITGHVKQKISLAGGDAAREALEVVFAKDGNHAFIDADGGYWRSYVFIDNSICYERIECNEDFYKCGLAFGTFAKMLIDFPVDKLFETIPHFHDTPKRFADFEAAVKNNKAGRMDTCTREIELCMSFKQYSTELMDSYKEGRLPLRVTHNDTKSNNVLFDKDTKDPVCVVDLDTVMPGFIVNDFADAIRFGANTAKEDEPDYEKAGIDLELYRHYSEGFLNGCGEVLTDEEIKLLPVGARMMAIENAIRFLGDYLNGDVYFKTAYPDHNLVRARTQIQLTLDMIAKWQQMNDIISEIIA